MELVPTSRSFLKKIAVCGTTLALLGGSGCSSVAPSRTATGAGTGAVVGGVGGAVVGNNSSLGTGKGAAIGAGAGALIGGIVGMVQDAKDRKEQDRLAQERAYQQELAKKRSEEARRKAESDEELAIAQGFRISDIELTDAQRRRGRPTNASRSSVRNGPARWPRKGARTPVTRPCNPKRKLPGLRRSSPA